MNAISNDIHHLVEKELAAANERFPQFHSAHEGYAVILEEMDELQDAVYGAKIELDCVWIRIKRNRTVAPNVKEVMGSAINAACEAIQVAAMCRKYMDMEADV